MTILAGLFVALLLVYGQIGSFNFITFDDPLYVTENLHVRTGLTADSIGYAWKTVVDSNWIPLTMISHMAAVQLFALNAGMHHWINVILHLLSAALVYLFFRRATSMVWPSAFIAFIFALHPLHVESVAWISERKDVLSTLFFFIGLYCYVRFAEHSGRFWYCASIGTVVLGLMAKPMLVTFAVVLHLLDIWPLRRSWSLATLREKAPFWVLSVIFAAIALEAQSSTGAVQTEAPGARIGNALVSYAGYIGQTLWPANLAMFYPRRDWITPWHAIAALLLILAISGAVIYKRREFPYAVTGWFWYLATLLPVAGFVQIGIQSHADRYMYIPMIGLSIVAAWGAADIVRRWPVLKPAVIVLGILIPLACLTVTSQQVAYWKNSERLYRRAIDVTSNNYVAEYNLGDYLMDVPGQAEEALKHFEAALRIQPGSADALNAIGGYYLQTGRDREAIARFDAALRSQPANAEAHFNLGLIYEKSPEHLADALDHYTAAVKSKPQWQRAQKNLGLLLLRLGRPAEAATHLQAAQSIQYDPEIARLLAGLS